MGLCFVYLNLVRLKIVSICLMCMILMFCNISQISFFLRIVSLVGLGMWCQCHGFPHWPSLFYPIIFGCWVGFDLVALFILLGLLVHISFSLARMVLYAGARD